METVPTISPKKIVIVKAASVNIEPSIGKTLQGAVPGGVDHGAAATAAFDNQAL
jgi:hypothetical protein